jgi:hypothetical protein
MGVDTSIYQNMLRPPKTVAEFDNERMAQQQNQLALSLGQQKADEYTRSVSDANRLRGIVGGFGAKTAQEKQQALQDGGYLKESVDYAKSNADLNKTSAETQKAQWENSIKEASARGSAAGAILQNPSYENAIAILTDLKARMHPEAAARMDLSKIPQDVEQIKQWATGTYRAGIDADKQLADATSRDNNSATNATSSANNAATVGATMRGQNMTAGTAAAGRAQADLHFGTAQAAGRVPAGYRANADGSMSFIPGGPADPSAGGGKAPTEFQGKAASFGARAEASNKILEQLEKGGTTNTGIIKSALVGVGEMVPFMGDKVGAAIGSGMNTVPSILGGPSGKQQQVEQARRDFVNAVLRQESGAAIGASEFENASRQYFPQPGDDTGTIAQKSRNRKLAIQGFMNSAGKAAFHAPEDAPEDAPSADIHSQADAILRGK